MKAFITIFICIILLVGSLLLLKHSLLKYRNGFQSNKPNCNAKYDPMTKNQNDIYKLHIEFKPLRDSNHMLAHNTESTSFFSSKSKGPKNIFIIRHGEKIKSKTELDLNGILRSTYIPELIKYLNAQDFGIHSIITPYDYNSMHESQTVTLTSWLLSIPIYMYGDQSQTENAVKELFTNPYYDGKSVLLCWEHNCIQTLLKQIIKIGSKAKGLDNYVFKNPNGNSDLPYWTTNNYKSIYHLDNELNFELLEENFTTCYPEDNDLITYGKQKCVK